MKTRSAPLRTWLGVFRALRLYHRYEVRGLEHALTPRAALLVGYHGRPLALDLCMLTVTLHDALGYLPHGVIHGHFDESRLLARLTRGIGLVSGDGPALAEAVARGEHVLVQPGGTREGCRSFRDRYRVDWGERMGYLKLAIKYQLPIIPVAGSGMDDLYLGLNDGYAWGKRLGMPSRLPLWLGVGATGVWPLSLPFPVKVVQRLGAPRYHHLRKPIAAGDREAMLDLHRGVVSAVQGLLDDTRAETA